MMSWCLLACLVGEVIELVRHSAVRRVGSGYGTMG